MFKRLIQEWRTNPLSPGLAAIGIILILATLAATWQRLGTPEHTEVNNKYYENKSQWQAMLMLPNKEFPFDVEHFTYQKPFDRDTSEAYKADQIRTELSARCLWWNWTPTTTDKLIIISCFKPKDLDYTKKPNAKN